MNNEALPDLSFNKNTHIKNAENSNIVNAMPTSYGSFSN
jgi:hypothetical protein